MPLCRRPPSSDFPRPRPQPLWLRLPQHPQPPRLRLLQRRPWLQRHRRLQRLRLRLWHLLSLWYLLSKRPLPRWVHRHLRALLRWLRQRRRVW